MCSSGSIAYEYEEGRERVRYSTSEWSVNAHAGGHDEGGGDEVVIATRRKGEGGERGGKETASVGAERVGGGDRRCGGFTRRRRDRLGGVAETCLMRYGHRTVPEPPTSAQRSRTPTDPISTTP